MSYILKTRDVGRDKHGISIHEYMCPDCGDVKIKTAGDAKKAKKCKKCSYLEKRTHSMTHSRQYSIYRSMRKRCLNSRHEAYHRYGGRGIAICDEWMTFEGFMKWDKFSEYEDGLCIDRIDNDKGYYPDNCRWSTYKSNNRNRSNNKIKKEDIPVIRMLFWSGLPHEMIAKIFGVSRPNITYIINWKIWNDI